MKEYLTQEEIGKFIDEGYVKIENAFSEELAEQGRNILWRDTGCSPVDSSTWKNPVVRLGNYTDEPFLKAANTIVLCNAFDQLVGKDRWLPRTSLGTFPIRFPSGTRPIDTGWHVDASFPGEDIKNYATWRININSKGRSLLMLFLFSDIGANDAPTRIKPGSHLAVARILEPSGEAGLSFMELASRLDYISDEGEVFATGKAGTVYLCHPFLVHAAQPHRGSNPRFLAQPPLLPKTDIQLERRDGNYSPVETAIRKAIGLKYYKKWRM